MKFVKTEDLREGMRLAKPIYTKQGVLLYERDSKITKQGISSVQNFGLIGLYILEPAEPVPPMSKEDIEFERFQTMAGFSLQEELDKLLSTQRQAKSQMISSMIIKNYGHMDKKINFLQNLRSREDYICKHCLNVAILCTLMSHTLNIKLEEQLATVIAGMVHDVGKLRLSPNVVEVDELSPEQADALDYAETQAHELLEKAYGDPMIRRICQQSHKILQQLKGGGAPTAKSMMGAKILALADAYDSMTAMKLGQGPASEIKAIRFVLDHPEVFDPQVVDALIKSINIITPGVSVELNTGEKALVLRENPHNLLRPLLLSFKDNAIIDLSDTKTYDDLEIVDIMKTLDNRYIIDQETLKAMGFKGKDE